MAASKPVEKTPEELDYIKAQTRKELAEAREAEAKAAVAKIKLDEAKEKREKELASNERHHLYRFIGSVDGTSVKTCMDQLELWARLDPGCDIEIEFFSPGGSVHSGMALYDRILQLREAGHHITTSTVGYAASMGGILLQAGDERIMGREAYILIHEVQAGAIGTMGEIEDEVDFLKMVQRRILGIFAERSNLTKQQLGRRWKRKNWWIDSKEALELGLVDAVR